jgi:hypothetical protein
MPKALIRHWLCCWGYPQPLCPRSVRPHRCASSVSTLPLRVRSRGRASARPMGFPPPLVPHINCEPRLPLPTERWDWAACRNALDVNRLWSAVYPYHAWGLDRSLPRPLLARRQERCYTAHRSPKRGPLQCLTRIGPPKGTLTSSARKPLSSPIRIKSVNFGELSAPLISGARRPAPRPPSGDGSCCPEGPTLGPCHRPSLNPLVNQIVCLFVALSLLRGAVCSPSSKVGDLRPPTPIHLSETSSDERSR